MFSIKCKSHFFACLRSIISAIIVAPPATIKNKPLRKEIVVSVASGFAKKFPPHIRTKIPRTKYIHHVFGLVLFFTIFGPFRTQISFNIIQARNDFVKILVDNTWRLAIIAFVPEWRNGRRGGLKNRWGNLCEFKSRLGHHLNVK